MKPHLSAFLHTESGYDAVLRSLHCDVRRRLITYLPSLLLCEVIMEYMHRIHMFLEIGVDGYGKAKCILT